MKWQPIETAPRDREILVWNGRRCDVAYYGWPDTDEKPVWFNGDVVVDATHWMPLPEPPK